jgi:urea transport system substrate-binding protein
MAGSVSLVLRIAGIGTAVVLSLPGAAPAQEGPIKVGILHSLSGTMAISETTLKDVMLMLIDDLNQKGARRGRRR